MANQLTYNQAVSALERALKFGIDPSLDPMFDICAAMGNPQERYPCIQVAGTNGKTSTTRMIAALLRAKGLHVGLYTSPHLVKYPERIEIDGQVVGDELFARATGAALEASGRAGIEATEFELLTAAALWLFADQGVDWAVLECGLGGRWDATSVVTPRVAVITGVALDHTEILGDTIEKIAEEKAAIIKPGSKVVLAHPLDAAQVFVDRANEVGAELCTNDPEFPMDAESAMGHLPFYQKINVTTAVAAVAAALGIWPSSEDVTRALCNLAIPGRFEILRDDPLVIIDAAHNPQSAQTLADELSRRFGVAAPFPGSACSCREDGKPELPTLLLGVLADKDVRGVVRILCPLFKRVIVTASSSPRAVSACELAAIVEEETGVRPEVIPSVAQARQMLEGEPIIATGSITLAGEVKSIW